MLLILSLSVTAISPAAYNAILQQPASRDGTRYKAWTGVALPNLFFPSNSDTNTVLHCPSTTLSSVCHRLLHALEPCMSCNPESGGNNTRLAMGHSN